MRLGRCHVPLPFFSCALSVVVMLASAYTAQSQNNTPPPARPASGRQPGKPNGQKPGRPGPGAGNTGRPPVQPPKPPSGGGRPPIQPPKPPGNGNGGRPPRPGKPKPPPRPVRPPQWGKPPNRPPSYHFRPADRGFLLRHYLRHLGYINRSRRPVLTVGSYFPYGDIAYLTALPPELYRQLPPPPPGFRMGYFDGYVVVYDPYTYYIADLIDLVQ